MKKIIRIVTIVLLSLIIYLSVGFYTATVTQHVYETKKTENVIEKLMDFPLLFGSDIDSPGTHRLTESKMTFDFTEAQVLWIVIIIFGSIIWGIVYLWKFISWLVPWLANSIWWLIFQGGFYNTFGWWGILGLIIILIFVIWHEKIFSSIDKYLTGKEKEKSDFLESQ